MNIVSLFDGMACGLTAIKRVGLPVKNYFASEIDKHAIKVAMKNHPEIRNMGSVEFINGINLPEINLLIGGSPCQSLSIAGDGSGFDGKSGLFYEYLRLYRELKARNKNLLFLLENVKMKSEWRDIISKELGVEPVLINSALVSGQKRERYYWTNIPRVKQPEDKGIMLKDILLPEVDEKYILKGAWLDWWYKNKEFQLKKGYSSLDADKASCLTARMYASWNGNFITVQINPDKSCGGRQPSIQNRVYYRKHKSPCLSASNAKRVNVAHGDLIRRLTPIECERLQTLPDNYTDCVSDAQRYKMLGNGWTIDVISHILSNIKREVIDVA